MDYLEIKNQLNQLSLEVEELPVECNWSLPTQSDKGLLTTNASFKLAKQLGKSPTEIAAYMVDQLNLEAKNGNLTSVEFKAEGPYVNVYLSNQGFTNLLNNHDINSLLSLPQDNRKVMFEYIGANVAKQLHIGHMRNLNIGEALRRVLSQKYPNLITDNHWGDWGVQFGVLLWAYKQDLDKQAYQQNPIAELQRLYVWGNAQEDTVDNWAELVREEFKKLEAGDEENTRLWQEFLQVSKQELKQDLKLLNVPQTDLEQGESFYEPYMTELIEFCDKYKLWSIDGHARYIDFKQLADKWQGLTDEKKQSIQKVGRAYFVSSQGYTTYVFRDVAARLQWADEHEVDLAITLTDNRQEHNFNQAFTFISYLASTDEFKQRWSNDTADRLQSSNLKHVGYGRLALTTGSISSRSGGNLQLREAYEHVCQSVIDEFKARDLDADQNILDAVTVAALKWQDLKTDPNTDVVLDPETIVSFEGDTGVYQLYTVVRLNSILNSSEITQSDVSVGELNDMEKRLLERVLILQQHLALAADNYDVSGLVNSLGSLTRKLNKWYEHNHVESAKGERKQTMLQFVLIIHSAIAHSLELLGINPVEKL